MKSNNIFHFLLVISFLIFHNQLFAGWEIVYRHESSDGMISYDVMLIENHRFKYSQNDGGFIFDVQTNLFSWYFNDMNGYWQNDLQNFRSALFEALKSLTDELLLEFPEDQRETYSAIFGQMTDVYKPPAYQTINDLKLEIHNTDNVEEIAGYPSEQYLIIVDGKKMEQIWIAPSLNISEQLNPVKINEVFTELIIDLHDSYHYMLRDEYKLLWEKGYVMKTLDSEGESMQIIKVEQRKIQSNELMLPSGFVPITAREIISSKMMKNDNDDYDTWD
jgi:hypothetical protein